MCRSQRIPYVACAAGIYGDDNDDDDDDDGDGYDEAYGDARQKRSNTLLIKT